LPQGTNDRVESRQRAYLREDANVGLWHLATTRKGAKPVGFCFRSSDVDLFGYGERVIDLNAEIAHGALNLFVPQQKLHCPQVASAAVD
jgi:hypothetical protein